MAMDADRLGAALKQAYDDAGVTPGDPITDDDLLQIQVRVAQAIITEITANATITSTGATGSGPAGGPLPIASLPGSIA